MQALLSNLAIYKPFTISTTGYMALYIGSRCTPQKLAIFAP